MQDSFVICLAYSPDEDEAQYYDGEVRIRAPAAARDVGQGLLGHG